MKDDRYYATVRRYTPVAGLIILALLSLGAWALWLIPAARALFSFVPNARVWAVLVFTFGIFVGAIYYIVVSLWSYNKWTANDLLHFGKVAFRAVVFVAAAAVLYFAGALTLNKIGLAPPIGQWFHDSTSSITLWVLYTAVIIVGMLAVRNASAIAAYATIVLSLLGRGALGVGSVFAMVASKAARLGGIAIAPVLKQVLYYLTPGLLLVALGVAPAVFNWYVPREVLDTVVFILVYALVVVFATVVVTRVRAQWAQIKPAAGVFPPKVAGLVGVAPFVIYFAQAICFFTAYFGIYLLLSSKVKAFQLFALSIPPKLVSTFHLNVDTIAVSNLTLIALAGSFILALVISWLASIVLQYLFEGQKAPSILVVLVVVTGLLSTYCGFTMWNGVVATADELRRGVATTKVLVAEFGDIEIRTLEVALSAATAQVDALDRELERSTRKALTARSAELELARSALETSFQQLTSETESYRDKAERYENDAKCEIAVGCISGLIGNDAVAMSLSGLAGAYRAAYRTLSDAKRTHELDVAALTKLSGNFDVALESGATLNDLQKSFREMWDQFGVLAAIDVRTPLNNLEASLNAALSSAVKPNPDIARIQRSHIDDLRDRIQVDGRAIQRMLDANPIHALPSSVETAIAKEDITRDIRTELDAIRKSVKERYDQSHELLASISANLNGMLRTISDEQESKLLAADAPNIANELNKARRELRQLPLIVVRPTKDIRDISGQLISQLKDVAGDAILGRINGLIDPKRIVDSLPREDSYPAVSEFGMQPLEIAVVALFWLSLVPLFFQVFIDFGLTTAVIFGVSAMRRHAGRQQT